MLDTIENTVIDSAKIREKAEDYYRNLDYYCSEAIVKTFIDELDLPLPPEAVAMASGFPLGLGGAGCTCGAVTGGIMVLGYFFGRSEAKDNAVFKAMGLTRELHDAFKSRHKSLCCSALTKDHKMMSPEHMEQCIAFTGEVAEMVAEIIARERDKEE
ncbi:MAG: hypothetical protein GY754_04945 [bacterium]|nr:hypothetical protein [bacterium]